MTVIIRGDKEVSQRFETFPTRARQKIRDRISALTDELAARIKAATPVKTGKLQGEITPRIYDGDSGRVAGYVSVFASDGADTEYPKAATLEYGTNKPRRPAERVSKIASRASAPSRRIAGRMSKAVHLAPLRYLRGPLEQMRPEIEAALDEAVAEAAAEDDAGDAL